MLFQCSPFTALHSLRKFSVGNLISQFYHRKHISTNTLWIDPKNNIKCIIWCVFIIVLGHCWGMKLPHSPAKCCIILAVVDGCLDITLAGLKIVFKLCFSYSKTARAAKILNWLGKFGVHQPLWRKKFHACSLYN